MSGMTILCIEDQFDNVATLTYMLEGIGYEVIAASNAKQAIDLFADQPVDGVLLKYNLPDAVGTSLRAELKAIRPNVPVLLFDGIGSQTPVMLRFFDAYLRNMNRVGSDLGDLEA
jgi:response regulator RpfG family c-di-GMP phosphodiesterase